LALPTASRLAFKATTAEEACEAAARTLGNNPHVVPFALLYLVDPHLRHVDLRGAAGIDVGAPASPARIHLDDERPVWPFVEAMAMGGPIVVDAKRELPPLPGGPWPEPAAQAVVSELREARKSEQAELTG